MQQPYLNIDIDNSLNAEGITSDLYINNTDECVMSVTTDWETLADDLFEVNCLTTGELVHDNEFTDGIEEILSTVEHMRDVIDRLEQRVFNSKIFLRDKWVLEGEKQDQESKSSCIVSYSEYTNYRYFKGDYNE